MASVKNAVEETKTRQLNPAAAGDDFASDMNEIIQRVTALSGLIHENMYRFAGWRFLNIGRSLERGQNTATMLSSLTTAKAPPGSLDLALEICDCAMSHRRLYTIDTRMDSVLELIALDPLNPRSIVYHLNEIQDQMKYLPVPRYGENLPVLKRHFTRLNADFSMLIPDLTSRTTLLELSQNLARFSNDFSAIYFS